MDFVDDYATWHLESWHKFNDTYAEIQGVFNDDSLGMGSRKNYLFDLFDWDRYSDLRFKFTKFNNIDYLPDYLGYRFDLFTSDFFSTEDIKDIKSAFKSSKESLDLLIKFLDTKLDSVFY